MIQDTYKKIVELVRQGREGEARTLAGENGITQSYIDLAKEGVQDKGLPNDRRAARARILERLAAKGKTPRRHSDDYDQPDFFEMWDAGEQDPLGKMIEESAIAEEEEAEETGEGELSTEEENLIQVDEVDPEMEGEALEGSAAEGLEEFPSESTGEPMDTDFDIESTTAKIEERIAQLHAENQAARERIESIEDELEKMERREKEEEEKAMQMSEGASLEERKKAIEKKYEIATKYYNDAKGKRDEMLAQTEKILKNTKELQDLEELKIDFLDDEEKLAALEERKKQLEEAIRTSKSDFLANKDKAANLKILPLEIELMKPKQLLLLLDDKNIYQNPEWKKQYNEVFLKEFKTRFNRKMLKFDERLKGLKKNLRARINLKSESGIKIFGNLEKILKKIIEIEAYADTEKEKGKWSKNVEEKLKELYPKLSKIENQIEQIKKYIDNPQLAEEEYKRIVEERRLAEEEKNRIEEEKKRIEEEKTKLYNELEKIKNINLYKMPKMLAEEEAKQKVGREKEGEELEVNKKKMDLAIKIDEKSRDIAQRILGKKPIQQ